MDRRVVIAGAALLVGAAAILVAIELRSGRADRSARSTGATPEPTIVDREPPKLESTTTPIAETITETTTSRVRDHRTGDRVAYDPDARSGDKRTAQRLPPDLVHTLSKQLEAVMLECTAAITADARGAKPKVTASVFVDVAGGSLQLTETAIELRDLTGDTARVAKDCMQARWVGQTVPAPDGLAATHYEISVVLTVPSR